SDASDPSDVDTGTPDGGPLAARPTYVQSVSKKALAATNTTVFAKAVQPGNTLLVAFTVQVSDGGLTEPQVTDDRGDAFTKVIELVTAPLVHYIYLATNVAGGTT